MNSSLRIIENNSISIFSVELTSINICKYIEITKKYAVGDNFYIGHYRKDGINLSHDDWDKSKRIIECLEASEMYKSLDLANQEKHLMTGCLPINDETYTMLPMLFHYYLETIYFCPKIDWDTFINSYKNYMRDDTNEYIIRNFTDVLFSYYDSGRFSISFNSNIYEMDDVYADIQKIVSWGQSD